MDTASDIILVVPLIESARGTGARRSIICRAAACTDREKWRVVARPGRAAQVRRYALIASSEVFRGRGRQCSGACSTQATSSDIAEDRLLVSSGRLGRL